METTNYSILSHYEELVGWLVCQNEHLPYLQLHHFKGVKEIGYTDSA